MPKLRAARIKGSTVNQ